MSFVMKIYSLKNGQYIVWFVVLPISIGIVYYTYQTSTWRVEKIGYDLLKMDKMTDWSSNRNNPVPGVVNIGRKLYGQIKSRTIPINTYKVQARCSDCYGDSERITHSILISNSNGELFVRLRFDWALLKYHIVGFTGEI